MLFVFCAAVFYTVDTLSALRAPSPAGKADDTREALFYCGASYLRAAPSFLISNFAFLIVSASCDECPPAFVFKAVEEDGRAGGADDLIEEKRAPAADETKV